jgi:hypothetical protein
MSFVPFYLLKATRDDWDTWSTTNVLTNGRVAMVIDEIILAEENAKAALSRDYSRAISLWCGVENTNVLIYGHEDVWEFAPTVHLNSIASYTGSDPELIGDNATNFNDGAVFNFDDAVLYVQNLLGLSQGIIVEELGGFVDTIDTRGRLPSAYLKFNTNGSIEISSQVSITPYAEGNPQTNQFLTVGIIDIIVYNPATGCPFLGRLFNNKYYDDIIVDWIGVPFGFTRNGTPYTVPVWVAPKDNSVLKYSDGKSIIFTLPDSPSDTALALDGQHSISLDLTQIVAVGDTLYVIDPVTKNFVKLIVKSRTTSTITFDKIIDNPYGEPIHINLWQTGAVSNGSIPNAGKARLGANLVANLVTGNTGDNGTVFSAGSEFPLNYKITGRVWVTPDFVSPVGFDIDDPANYDDSWAIVDGGNVIGIRFVTDIVSNSPYDIDRVQPTVNTGGLSHYGNKAGIIPGYTYLLPASDYDIASRLRNIPALRIASVRQETNMLVLGFDNPIPVAEFAEWIRAYRDNIYDPDTEFMCFALAQRAAVIETGLIRGTHTAEVGATIVKNLVYTSGLRINNEPDNPLIKHEPFGDPNSAWDHSSPPKTDIYPDVYNPRDAARFTLIKTDQLGSSDSSDIPIPDIRLIRAKRILLHSAFSPFDSVGMVGVKHAVTIPNINDAKTQGIWNAAYVTSRVVIPGSPVGSTSAINYITNTVFGGDVHLYDIWLSSNSEFDRYHHYGSTFPVTGVLGKQVSTDECLCVTVPEAFTTGTMLSRHDNSATGYDVYRISLNSMQPGWSFILILPDLGMLKEAHPNTSVIISGTRYQPKSYQTQYPQTIPSDPLPNIVYRELASATRYHTKVAKQLRLFGNNVIGSGINPDIRLAGKLQPTTKIPAWPIVLRITCTAGDHDQLMTSKSSFIIENLSAAPLHHID